MTLQSGDEPPHPHHTTHTDVHSTLNHHENVLIGDNLHQI